MRISKFRLAKKMIYVSSLWGVSLAMYVNRNPRSTICFLLAVLTLMWYDVTIREKRRLKWLPFKRK